MTKNHTFEDENYHTNIAIKNEKEHLTKTIAHKVTYSY